MYLAAILVLPLASLVHGIACNRLILPEPKGPYLVTLKTEELLDPLRIDPWNDGSQEKRRIMTSRFIPVPRPHCTRTCRIPYMSAEIASAEDEIITSFISELNVTWPHGLLASLDLQVCCGQVRIADPVFHPRVLFGTGLNTTRLFYSSVAQHLASLGWDVTVMDHPYETDIVQFSDGTIITGGRVKGDLNNIPPLIKALDVRADDASLVLNHLGIKRATEEVATAPDSKAAFIGQSFGGAAAAMTMRNETRIVAGVNLDGYMFGPVLEEGLGRNGVNQSFLLWGAEGHGSANFPSWKQFLESMRRNSPQAWVKELGLLGGAHGSFTDFSIIADVAELRGNQPLADALGVGEGTGERAMGILGAYMDDFLNMTLLGAGPGLIAGPSERFPEVVFLN